jgi:hypothetical protein
LTAIGRDAVGVYLGPVDVDGVLLLVEVSVDGVDVVWEDGVEFVSDVFSGEERGFWEI